jgi:hypothetical protein
MCSGKAFIRAGSALIAVALFWVCMDGEASDPQSEVRALLKTPDVYFSGTYELPVQAKSVEKLLSSPLLLAKLWEAYGFSPQYKARNAGNSVHVDDPTGIAGDITLVEQSPNRYVFLGVGNLNHKLVPAFGGKMAVVLTIGPATAGAAVRLDLYIRADNRAVGMLAWGFSPLMRSRVENRVSLNVLDLTTIMEDLSTSLPQTAARLARREDAVALIELLSPRVQPPALRKVV